MTPSEFTHPDDAAALKTLESIPVLPAVVKLKSACWLR